MVNARVVEAVRTLELLTEDRGPETVQFLRQEVAAAPAAVDPQWLETIAGAHGYRVELLVPSSDKAGLFDAVALRDGNQSGRQVIPAAPEQHAARRDWASYSNNPLRSRITRDVVPELRERVEKRLPEYMMPSKFMLLDELPLTPSGKVDRLALPDPDGVRLEVQADFVAPRNPVESELARIWGEVLGLDRVGIHDNFFELGGDSILSIQVVSRAGDAGIVLNATQMFEYQTIALLAMEAGSAPKIEAEQGVITGDVPLTPIQWWLLDQDLEEPEHFNQAIMLVLNERVGERVCAEAVRRLIEHHDALRLRVRRAGETWRQFLEEPGEDVPFEYVDLSNLGAMEQSVALKERADGLQRSLDPANGPIVRVALFDLGEDRGQRLLMIIHHLAVDLVSWRILRDDLERVCGQLMRNEPVELPPKGSSFQAWATRLEEHAQTEEMGQEFEYWLGLPWEKVAKTPVTDRAGRSTWGDVERVTSQLDEEQTRRLLTQVPKAYNTQIVEVLLAAVAEALCDWTGGAAALINVEGHGREDLFEDIDHSRTVGWFAAMYPLVLELPEAASSGEDPGATVKAVKEQVRRVPGRGVGYGMLRYPAR